MRRICTFILALFLASMARAQSSVSIHDIMVAGSNPVVGTAATRTLPYSPYYGQTVSVTGIVVGVESSGDYPGTVYISEPSANWDSLILTAEGMPVFNLAALNSACAVVGTNITIVGQVVLSTAVVPADVTAAGTPGTGILPASCTAGANGTMTQSISLGTTLNSFGGALEYTGMTTNATFYAVAPTTGTLNAATGNVASTGQFWATLSSNTATNSHLFRSLGIAKDEYYPASSSAAPTWAGNPQRILIDTTTFGGAPVNITVGQTISCTTGANIKAGATAGIGLIDYTLGYARLLIFPTSVCTVGGTVAATTSAIADATHFKVGTLDLNAFADTNPAFATRLAKAAAAIATNLGAPDIMSVQEVSDFATLSSLATAVNSLGATTYVPYLTPGSGSTNVGFLIKSSTLITDSVTQAGLGSTYVTSAGGSALLWDSPPLVLQAEFVRLGKNYPVTVINPLFTSRDNSGDPALGADIRLRRESQASAISQLVAQYEAAGQNVVVAGNLNAFEFSDGYVDVTGVIAGSPASAVINYIGSSNVQYPLTDLNTQVPALQRYNFIERGDAVTYEHILASATVPDANTAAQPLASYATGVTQPHFSTDFYATNANSISTPAGLTPHDGFVVAFLIPPVPTTASITPASIDFGSVDLGGTSPAMTATITNTTTFNSTINISKVAISGNNASDFAQTSTCASLTQGSTCTVSLTFTPTALGARSAVLTVTNDSTSNPSLVTNLTGTGIDTTATLTPASATFGSIYAGGGLSAPQTFTVTNTSLVAIAIKSVTIAGNFTQTNNCPATLASGATCTIAVTFAPITAGALNGTLTVMNSTTANPVLISSLTGTGLPTTATLTPASASFGAVVLGRTSVGQAFVWTNTSAIPLTIASVSSTGAFTIAANTCTGTITAGRFCVVTVAFSPVALGTVTGSVTIASSASANPTLTATLTGRGVADVQADLASLDFGNIDLGYSSPTQTFTITNYTNAAIGLTSISISGDYAFTTTCGSTLVGLASCTVNIAFTPTAVGTRPGAVTVLTNDTRYPVITVALTGNGVDFAIAINPTSGSTLAGYTVAPTVTLTPLGGFSTQIALGCSTSAPGSTCTPQLTPLLLSGNTAMPLTITTTSRYTVIGYGGFGPWWLSLVAALSSLAFGLSRRRKLLPRLASMLLALALLVPANLGCGTQVPGQNSSPTLPGTYTYTVTATDGKIAHTTTYSLTVAIRY